MTEKINVVQFAANTIYRYVIARVDSSRNQLFQNISNSFSFSLLKESKQKYSYRLENKNSFEI